MNNDVTAKMNALSGEPLVILILCTMLVSLGQHVFTCPHNCMCIIRTNQLVVNCSNAGYVTIPDDLPRKTIILDMSGNALGSWSGSVLMENVPNLQKLYFDDCDISCIGPHAFAGLRNLEALYLRNNKLREVPSLALRTLPHLRILSLKGNYLTKLEGSPFLLQKELEKLDLSHCNLTRVDRKTFLGLTSVSYLNLAENNFVTLSSQDFSPMTSLLQLDVHGNSLYCNCSLYGMIEFLRKRRIGYGKTPRCEHPLSMLGLSWDDIPTEKFACYPTVRTRILRYDRKLLTLECEATADPQVDIYWLYNGKRVNNSGLNYSVITSGFLNRYSVLTIEITENKAMNILGMYVCIARNTAGAVLSTLTISTVHQEEELDFVSVKAGTVIVIIILSCVLIVFLCLMFVVFCLNQRRKRLLRVGKQRMRAKTRVKVELSDNPVVQTDTIDTADQDSGVGTINSEEHVIRDRNSIRSSLDQRPIPDVVPSVTPVSQRDSLGSYYKFAIPYYEPIFNAKTFDHFPLRLEISSSDRTSIDSYRPPSQLWGGLPSYLTTPRGGASPSLLSKSPLQSQTNHLPLSFYRPVEAYNRFLPGMKETDLDRTWSPSPIQCPETDL